MPSGHCRRFVLSSACFVGVFAGRTFGQSTQPAPGIAINFPASMEVKAFVDYVSARTNRNIAYDDELLKKAGTITLRSPQKVAAADLPALLEDVLRGKGLGVTTDPATGWTRIVTMPATAAAAAVVDHVTLKFADASRLAPQIKQLVGASLAGTNSTAGFDVSFDARTSQVIAIGPADAVRQAIAVATLLDVPVAAEESPIRFYKLTNATAADVLDTIRDLQGKPASVRPRAAEQRRDVTPTAGSTSSQNGTAGAGQQSAIHSAVPSGQVGGAADRTLVQPPPVAESIQPTPAAGGGDSNKFGYESVTADANTNTIIVRGSADVQQTYERLIKTLDQRRPQVLLEATVVTLDTTHNFTFGVEFSAHSNGSTRLLTFSQFGLSSVDTTTGALHIIPNQGLNTAVIGSGVANAVIQALVTDTHVRVQATPRVLVNDNATGLLTSISEQPYTSVNASTTVATTSFGGYADAGTTVTLTPHISEGDYLQLEYSVELSSFTGLANTATGSPPPRQTDRVESKVTIPDGATIIVGGLNRRSLNTTVNAIPILGQIPVLGWLFSDRNNTVETATLFVFLRPTILRDEEFSDLRNLSEGDLKSAGIPSNLPASEPHVMR